MTGVGGRLIGSVSPRLSLSDPFRRTQFGAVRAPRPDQAIIQAPAATSLVLRRLVIPVVSLTDRRLSLRCG